MLRTLRAALQQPARLLPRQSSCLQPPNASSFSTFPRIKEVRAYVVESKDEDDQGADCHDVALEHWINGNVADAALPGGRVFGNYYSAQARAELRRALPGEGMLPDFRPRPGSSFHCGRCSSVDG